VVIKVIMMFETIKLFIKGFFVTIFREEGIKSIKKEMINPLVILFIFGFMQAFPSSFNSIESFIFNFVSNFAIIIILSMILCIFLYIIARMLGSKIKIKEYIKRIMNVFLITSLAFIIVAFLLINFGILINYPEVALKVVQGGFLSYYLFVVFGWSTERLAGFDDLKGTILGIVAVILIYIFHLITGLLP